MNRQQTLKALTLGVILFLLYKKRKIQEKIGVLKMPRGIRNNNPMNLRKSTISWQGKVEGTDTSFETFVTPEYGIRAGAKVLMTYQSKYALKSVREIINRFAPPIENNTDSYIKHVASVLNVDEDEPINIKEHLIALITTIIKHENGIQPYDSQTIKNGVSMALA